MFFVLALTWGNDDTHFLNGLKPPLSFLWAVHVSFDAKPP